MAPDVRDWLPEGHLAWFVIDAVAAMDLHEFYAAYRSDGRSRPAYEPSMMVALLLYAYARGVRSARAIERGCEEDVAYRVIAAQQKPDHATIARFVERHQDALAGLFGSVLGLCAQAGLVSVGVVAIDGTKLHANASRDATFDYERIAREIVEEAKAVDAAEDELYGGKRGDELPPELATAQGRRKWLREAQRRLDEKRAQQARPVPRSRPARLNESKRRLEEELQTECQANQAYEAYRARGVMKNGRRFGAHGVTGPSPSTYRDGEEILGALGVQRYTEGLAVRAQAADRSHSGVAVTRQADLEQNGVIFPKLFRRLTEFLADQPADVSGFLAWLADKREQVLDLPTNNFTHFDNVVGVQGDEVALLRRPEEIVFVSAKTASPTVAPWLAV